MKNKRHFPNYHKLAGAGGEGRSMDPKYVPDAAPRPLPPPKQPVLEWFCLREQDRQWRLCAIRGPSVMVLASR